jgi:predicted HicB family RNase H-like nuclease
MKKTYIHLQVEEDFKKQLENEAKQKGLSLNAYVRMLLIERGK